MSQITLECPKCHYRWWVEAVGDMPPNPNCSRCFPVEIVTSITGTDLDKPILYKEVK